MTLKLAIDWTPNINHIGFFVADALSFYKENGLNIEIINPADDNYRLTPAKKVELGKADFALCPLESVLSYRVKDQPCMLMALAAMYQEDVSAIVVKDQTINSPIDLDGKSYASYKARYEDKIVEQVIKNDGGKGSVNMLYPDKLGIWETVLKNKADATWIFTNWEGIQAQETNEQLSYFKLKDYDIPYSYSPVLVAEISNINRKKEAIKKFMNATKKGFLFSKDNPEKACVVLSKHVPKYDENINLIKALSASSPFFGDQDNWGMMDPTSVYTFLLWLHKNNLETTRFMPSDIITNEFLE